ncbi:MAG: hypothetical protein O7C01_05310 [Actinobacteria bacterium]|nr:hypothetical protein [Actinomycetota bacterium]
MIPKPEVVVREVTYDLPGGVLQGRMSVDLAVARTFLVVEEANPIVSFA